MRLTISLLLLLFALTTLVALTPDQQRWLSDHPGQTPNWLLPGEQLPTDRTFTPTDPPTAPVRAVAEFEPCTGALVRYNYGLSIPVSLVAAMSHQVTVVTIVSSSSQITTATNSYQAAGADVSHCVFMLAPTDTEWARDYGPWFIFDGDDNLAVVDFPYNRPRPNDDDIPIEYADYDTLSLYGMDLTSTGGNYMCDGLGQAASTELIWEENTDLTHAQIAQLMEDYLGVTQFHVITDPLGEYIKHIDCWGKFLGVDKVLIGQVAQSDSRYAAYEAAANYFATRTSSWGTPFRVYRVYTPGGTQVTPYTNSLILNHCVYVPQSGSQWDDDAIASYQTAMPGYQIVGMSYNDWYNTDALHCRVHELADKNMLYIHHTPVADLATSQPVNIDAYIHPYSGTALYPDSLLVFYRVQDDEDWTPLIMTDQGNETYRATIPAQTVGSVVEYYIYAADHFGRHERHPLIGAYDPHVFHVSDSIAPVLNHTPLTDMTYDSLPVDVFATATDNGEVQSVSVFYSIGTPGVYTELPMTHGTGDQWSAQFSSAMFEPNDVVNYYLQASDLAWNVAVLPTSGCYSFALTSTSQTDQVAPLGGLRLFPNPSRDGRMSVAFSLPIQRVVEAAVYNLKGQRIRVLQSGMMGSGARTLVWDGCDDQGRAAGEGMYFVRVSAGDWETVRKALIVK
jgi:agmatine deiminase